MDAPVNISAKTRIPLRAVLSLGNPCLQLAERPGFRSRVSIDTARSRMVNYQRKEWLRAR